MEYLYWGVVCFLFALSSFDLYVGVSNDAVNFLGSAIGAKAASFKRVMIVAAAGVFIGAAMSNGMMDIARHGIFQPEHFSFYEIICIFMAVMVTDALPKSAFAKVSASSTEWAGSICIFFTISSGRSDT